MTTTDADLIYAALGSRLRDLCAWLADALDVGELRDSESIKAAKEAFLVQVYRCWDHNNGDWEGALTIGLLVFVEFSVGWADGNSKIEDDLALSANPPWELTEFNLLVASALADKALLAFERGTKKQMALAAMLYADAIEAREAWDKMRGPAGARNPDTRYGRLHQGLRALDEEIAIAKGRKRTGLEGARAKLKKDAKQAAKVKAHQLWLDWQAGKATHRNQSAFCRHVCEQLGLKDAGNVGAWCRTWRKQLVR
mgnify:CR=1 FL=1